MKPFNYTKEFNNFDKLYPNVGELLDITKKASNIEIFGIIRLWFTEGIPYAFKEYPILYEIVREWLGSALEIHPKLITLIGSGRIGFSLAPPPKLGKLFDKRSDLDFSIISENLFNKCAETFHLWIQDYSNKVALPRDSREKFFWDKNLEIVPNNIERGFIDPPKIPTFNKYKISQRIGNTMWLLKEKLNITKNAPEVSKVSIRVYNNWGALINQLKINWAASVKAT